MRVTENPSCGAEFKKVYLTQLSIECYLSSVIFFECGIVIISLWNHLNLRKVSREIEQVTRNVGQVVLPDLPWSFSLLLTAQR